MHAVIIVFFMFSPPIYGRIIYADQEEIPIAVIYGRKKAPAIFLLQEQIKSAVISWFF
jgi:hypothetical protein